MFSDISFFIYFYIMKRFVILCFAVALGFLWLASGCRKDKITGNIPVITLVGNDTVNAGIGYPYVDAGAKAYDKEDGDITSKIVTVNNVNISVLGMYHVYFDVSDSDGNKAKQVTRTVNVIYTK
jgi:hypothetical protein